MAIGAIADLFDLSGKSAVVTGGGSGIGRATAMRLAQAGASVSVVDIDGPGASAAVEERFTQLAPRC